MSWEGSRFEEFFPGCSAAGGNGALTIRRLSGSHVYFAHPRRGKAVSVPAGRSIKPAYVRAFACLMERVRQA
jgi:hypothetical protein